METDLFLSQKRKSLEQELAELKQRIAELENTHSVISSLISELATKQEQLTSESVLTTETTQKEDKVPFSKALYGYIKIHGPVSVSEIREALWREYPTSVKSSMYTTLSRLEVDWIRIDRTQKNNKYYFSSN